MAIGDKKKALMEGSTTAEMVGAAPSGLSEIVALYVATTGSDETGDGSQTKPYATIQKAVASLPKLMNGSYALIRVAPGTYTEQVEIGGFTGGVYIWAQDNANKPKIIGGINGTHTNGVYLSGLVVEGQIRASWGCTMYIDGCDVSTTGANAVIVEYGGNAFILSCKFTASGAATYGGAIYVRSATCSVANSTITEETICGISAIYSGIVFMTTTANNAQTKTANYHGKIYT